MKKLGLGMIALAIIGALYYISMGSSQLTQELKTVVNQELTTLQQNGFAIEERQTTENSEYFVLVLNDTQKITEYLNKERLQITPKETAWLSGMKFGIDLQYLKDSYSALSFDLYPITLPASLTSGELTQEDRDALAKIDTLFKNKTFLTHIDINKMLNGFKGAVKDIDENIEENGQKSVFTMHAFTFSGDIKDNKITGAQQELKTFLLHIDNEFEMKISDAKSSYTLHGASPYDTTMLYTAAQVAFSEAQKAMITLNGMEIHTKSDFTNELIKSDITTKIASIDIKNGNTNKTLEGVAITSKVSNLDIQSIEKFKHIDMLKQEEVNTLAQKILSTGLSFEIPHFAITNIISEQKTLGGFDLNAKLDIDKSINLALIQINPLAGLASLNANLKLSLSDTLFTFVSQQPDALLAMMMFQPTEENGKKVYLLELKNGALKVNGTPMM